MPLQLTFHLELVAPDTVTAVWDERKNQLRVTAIAATSRLINELKKHADEAGVAPEQLDPVGTKNRGIDTDLAWTLLESYNHHNDTVKEAINKAFIPVFSRIDIEYRPSIGVRRKTGEIRLFMGKPNGHHTNAWIWKDSVTWINPTIPHRPA